MDEAMVLGELKRLHREIEEDAGKNPDLVADDVQPLEGLCGFDSLLIPNVIRGLARAIGVTLAKGARLRNPYVGSDRQKLTLEGVAKRFCKLYGKGEKSS
jgi:hypothetical protein